MPNNLLNRKVFVLAFLLLALVSLTTSVDTVFEGNIQSTDFNDYAGVAKFFAGSYSADIRSSHSLIYGFTHSPLVYLFKTFWILKVASIFWIFIIILSVYYITNKIYRQITYFSECGCPSSANQ